MAVATRLTVAAPDRVQLTAWVRAATTRRSLAERARIILLSAEGLSAATIAERLGDHVHPTTDLPTLQGTPPSTLRIDPVV